MATREPSTSHPNANQIFNLQIDSSVYDTAREEVRQKFKNLREEIDKKERNLLTRINEIEHEDSSNTLPAGKTQKINIVWHLNSFLLALESISLLVRSSAKDSLIKTKKLWETSGQGSNRGELCNPKSFALSEESGKIYIADTGNKRISCFDSLGRIIRVRDLTNITPFTSIPELIILNPIYDLLWIYATDGQHLFHFLAINTDDFNERHNVKTVSGVKALSIGPTHHNPVYYCYTTSDHSITYGEIDKDDNKAISLESYHLDGCQKDVQLEVFDEFIYVLYRDSSEYRILKFDFKGKLCQCYFPCQEFGKIECFSLISPTCFVLGRIGDAPINKPPKSNVLSPERKENCLQVCMVSADGQIRGQLSHPVRLGSEELESYHMKCSQLIVHENKLIILLRGCSNNLIAF
ncbi:hypothetical protein LOD99_12977 [Oopsacas minuta]|uniref:Uncharacterized protein n=1 Tax=Oopsacas minuta TaxID=111878 RepID=A0AAV7JAH4_9METZ|nr:hypothetical protein LOD99_12977 [Oopsacas minuta]